MPAKYIRVNDGVNTTVHKTTAETIGQLFTAQFREDYNIGGRARATVNGVVADDDHIINANDVIGYRNTASSKS